MSEQAVKKIGYWLSEKKSQKLNWAEFANVCRNHGYELVKLDLDQPFTSQGPFAVFLHKLTDIIVQANDGDQKSAELISRIEEWMSKNPQMVVLDPIDNVRKLLDRYVSYSVIHESGLLADWAFVPKFAKLSDDLSPSEMTECLRQAGVQYPLVCKPLVAHGSRKAHEMSLVFNEQNLIEMKTPCVAQTFVNHSALLYKVFIVGDYHCVVERPSLKNFYPSDRAILHFDSQHISKADSRSVLSVLDPSDKHLEPIRPDPEKLTDIVCAVRKALGMSLLGVDVVIEINTGRYAIIDVNAYPGYDGFPNFFDALMVLMEDAIGAGPSTRFPELVAGFGRLRSPLDVDRDSGFDTADSCDERGRMSSVSRSDTTG